MGLLAASQAEGLRRGEEGVFADENRILSLPSTGPSIFDKILTSALGARSAQRHKVLTITHKLALSCKQPAEYLVRGLSPPRSPTVLLFCLDARAKSGYLAFA